MKKILLMILVIFLGVVSCRKERNENGYYWGHGFGMGYGAGCFDDRGDMMGQLSISRADADRITAIDEKYRPLYYENRGDYKKIDALRIKHLEEIRGVLAADQKTKFDSVYNRRWGGWGHGYGRRMMGDYYGHGYGMGYGSGCWGSIDSMSEYLKLTPAQSKKIVEIDEKYRGLYYRDRGNYSKIDDLRRQHRVEIEKVLTGEQKSRYQEVYDNRWRGGERFRGMGPGMMGY